MSLAPADLSEPGGDQRWPRCRDRKSRRARRDAAACARDAAAGPTLIQQSTQPAPRPPSGASAPIVHRAAGGADGGARATRGAVQGGRGGRRERAAAAELAALQEENQKLRAEIEAVRTERGAGNGEAGGRGAHGRVDQDGRTGHGQGAGDGPGTGGGALAERPAQYQPGPGTHVGRANGGGSADDAERPEEPDRAAGGARRADERRNSAPAQADRGQRATHRSGRAGADRGRSTAGEMRDTVERAEQDKGVGADLAKAESWRAPSSRPSGSMRRSASGRSPGERARRVAHPPGGRDRGAPSERNDQGPARERGRRAARGSGCGH